MLEKMWKKCFLRFNSLQSHDHNSSSVLNCRCEKQTATEMHKYVNQGNQVFNTSLHYTDDNQNVIKLIRFCVLWWMREKVEEVVFFLSTELIGLSVRSLRQKCYILAFILFFSILFPLPHKIIPKTICTESKITCCLALAFCHLNLSLCLSLSVLKASMKSHRKQKLGGGGNRTLKCKRLVDISNALSEAINKNN